MKSGNCGKFSNLSNWKEEVCKNQGFNGIQTRDLRDSGAMLYQMSYKSHIYLSHTFTFVCLCEETAIVSITSVLLSVSSGTHFK